MKVILICPKVAALRTPLMHNIGIAYVAASLRHAGYTPEIIDIFGKRYSDFEVLSILKTSLNVPEKIWIGIGSIVTCYSYVKWLVKEIKKIRPDAYIVIGNSLGSSIYNFIFDEMPVDAVVLGEGEATAVELARAIDKGLPLENVDGICFRTKFGFKKNKLRSLIENIDDIPLPALDLFDMEIYLNNQKTETNLRTIYISTTRGCPYKCTYCYHAYQGSRTRHHSVERSIAELKLYKINYGIEGFVLSDDLFMLNRERVEKFCDALEGEGLNNLKWSVAGRANSCQNLELIKRMKKSGCQAIGMGIETGDQRILNNINKRTTVEMGLKAINNCFEAGLKSSCSFMIGNEGENYDSIKNTLEFIDKANIEPPVTFFFATPYPDTELFNRGMKKGIIKNVKKLVESYGEQGASLLVNFSELSDAELINLKNSAQLKIVLNYARKNKLWFISYLFKRTLFYIKTINNYFNEHGAKETINRIYDKLMIRLKSLYGGKI